MTTINMTIDATTRQISTPSTVNIEQDNTGQVIQFSIADIADITEQDITLVYANYITSNGTGDKVECTDIATTDGTLTFNWTVPYGATYYSGNCAFNIWIVADDFLWQSKAAYLNIYSTVSLSKLSTPPDAEWTASLTNKLSELITEVESATTDVSTLQTDVTTAEETITTLQENVATANTDTETLQTNVDAATATMEALQTDLNTASTNIASLQETINAAEGDTSTLQSTVDGLQTTVNTLEDIVSTAQATLDALNVDIVAAQTAATTATEQATTATTGATTATTKAAEAVVSAESAQTSATNASTSATNAATSETNAEASATSLADSAAQISTNTTNIATNTSEIETARTDYKGVSHDSLNDRLIQDVSDVRADLNANQMDIEYTGTSIYAQDTLTGYTDGLKVEGLSVANNIINNETFQTSAYTNNFTLKFNNLTFLAGEKWFFMPNTN